MPQAARVANATARRMWLPQLAPKPWDILGIAFCRGAARTHVSRRRYHQTCAQNAKKRRNNLTLARLRLSFCRPAHRGRLRRRARVGAGCGVLRAWLVTTPPGGVRATPPFRHYERNVRMHPCETEGHRSCAPSGGLAKAGSEPINRRGGAPKGGHPRRADCVSGLRGMQGATFRACGPTLLAREGCLASTRAPVGAPLPSFTRGNIGKPRRTSPRENDDASAQSIVHWPR